MSGMGMKVWIVESGWYPEDRETLGVYSTEAGGLAAATRAMTAPWDAAPHWHEARHSDHISLRSDERKMIVTVTGYEVDAEGP